MIRLFNFILKLVIWILLLLAMCIVSIIMFVNPGNYKPQISSFVEKHTGHKLQVNGDIKWSLRPISLYLQDIIIMDPDSNGPQALLESKEAHIVIKPLDYLLALFNHKKKQEFLLKLNATMFYGLKTKVNVESNININSKLQVKGNVRLLPVEYKNNTKASPLTIAFTLDKEQVQIVIDEKNIDMQIVSQIFISEPLLSGEGSIKVNLSSLRKHNGKGLLGNLAGSMDVSIKNGKLKGIDIFSTLSQTEQNINDLFDTMRSNVKLSVDLLLSNGPKAINNVVGENYFSGFEELLFKAFFKDGVADRSGMLLQHTSYVVQGGGLIDLPKNNLNYKFYATLSKLADHEPQHVNEIVHEVPLLIKVDGPINQPIFSMDIPGYVRGALQELQKSLFSGAIGSLLKK